MDISIFQEAGNIINEALNAASESVQNGWISELKDAAKIGIALYLLVYGYMVLAGKKQAPVPDLLWDMARFGFILYFMETDFLKEISPIVDGVKSFLSGEPSSYALMDKRVTQFISIVAKLWKENSWYLAILLVLLCIPMALGVTALGAVLIFTDVTLKILIATAPIYIFCLMWGWLKDSFSQWLQAIIGNCFVILFVNVFSKVGFKLAEYATSNNFDGIITIPMLLLIAGTMTMLSVYYGRNMAFELSRVAIDKTIGGKAAEFSLYNKIKNYLTRSKSSKIN